MSQTILKRGSYTIICGWDSPCQHFFGNIETPSDQDQPHYSTMDDVEADVLGGFANLDDVKTRIEKIVGTLPDKFWKDAAIRDMNMKRFVEDE